MDAELYSRIFCALGIALMGSLVFVAIGHMWMAMGAKLQRRNPLAEQILFEPGHRIRLKLQNLDRRYYLFLSATLVYGLLLIVAFVLQREPLLDDASALASEWGWLALSGLLLVASAILPVQVVKLKRARSRLAVRRTANIAVGHALHRIACKG